MRRARAASSLFAAAVLVTTAMFTGDPIVGAQEPAAKQPPPKVDPRPKTGQPPRPVPSKSVPVVVPTKPGLPSYVYRALQNAAARMAPAIVQLEVERYAPTRVRERLERRLRRDVRRTFDLDDALEEADVSLRYFERPAGPATGVIIERSGFILTSKFAIEGAIESLRVALPDGRVFPGIVLGWDGALDIAAVQIVSDERTFPCIDFTPPKEPAAVGAFIAILGASWGRVGYTLNPGIVSALDRMGGRAMQLCSHVNYGNSGGPVIDLDGKLVGITGHVRPFNRTGQNSGVAFCTRTEKVIERLSALRRGERKEEEKRPYLGIRVTPADEVAGKKHVYLEQVIPGSGAESAGLKVGDALVSIGGTRIVEPTDLRLAMARLKPGMVVNIVVKRAGKTVRASVQVGTRE